MHRDYRFRLLFIGCLLAGCLAATAGAVTIGTDWRVRGPAEGPYQGVQITPDASLVYAGGGSEMYFRSWDGTIHWARTPARVVALSDDGSRVITGIGNTLAILNNTGTVNWSRNMDGEVTAAAISPDGSFVIAADSKGHYTSWRWDGDLVARFDNRTANALAYSPAGDLVVAVTDNGLMFLNRKLEVIWVDNRTVSRDAFIAIAADGSTVITAGDRQVASYRSDGTLNWREEVTTDPIIDMRCSSDGSTIIVAGQDKEIVALGRSGIVHWRYPTGQWVNAVGVSRDASVIAAGGIDRTLYVLDHSGTLIGTKKTENIIQPRSIAVSSDGRRIAVADQSYFSGFSLLGDTIAPEVTETFTRPPLNPVPTTNAARTPATTKPEPAPSAPATTGSPVTARPTTYAPADPLILVPAFAAALLLLGKRR